MQRIPYFLYIPILALFGAAAFLYFGFSAEDAFITYRYAENLATTGSFVFNEGEPIMALTSPLHGLLVSVLFLLTGHVVVANKVLGFVLLVSAAAFVWFRFKDQPHLQLLVATLILLPPCMVLWAFGGLETPLLLFLVTSATILAASTPEPGRGRLCSVFLLAGLAFVTRFDSVLFMGPLVLHMIHRARTVKDVAIATVAGVALPLAWLSVSLVYYGDIFPTSFYSKPPMWRLPVLIGNAKYVLFFLFAVGIVPMLIVALALMRRWRTMSEVLLEHFRASWWLYLGIAAELLYGLTMAQTHMMFSFRFFVPYIPAFTIIVAGLIGRSMESRQFSERRRVSVIALAVLGLAAFQGFQIYYTYDRSVNGLSPWGEYRSVGVRQYTRFIATLRSEARNIREHWNASNESKRLPRIYTYAGGVVPYTFRDSYVYETLVSYRHCYNEQELIKAPNVWMKTNIDLRRSADYIHVITPRHGPIAPQLPLPEEDLALISSFEIEFDGYPERFLVFYNPEPAPHRLTSRIDGLCTAHVSQDQPG